MIVLNLIFERFQPHITLCLLIINQVDLVIPLLMSAILILHLFYMWADAPRAGWVSFKSQNQFPDLSILTNIIVL